VSISASLHSALSGLTANARAAELVSNNVANATNPSYARREIVLGARVVGTSGQGVGVLGTERSVNLSRLSDHRISHAAMAGNRVRADFHLQAESALGANGDPGSLTGRLASLESSLIQAASRPDSDARLADVHRSLVAVTSALRTASDTVQAARLNADKAIAANVSRLNDSLAQVAEMNALIRAARANGSDPSGLMDQRQQVIDSISTIVPIRQVQRDHDQIALVTLGGATLLDGRAYTFGFTPVNTITPEMTLQSGALSGLTLNGRPVPVDAHPTSIAGGTLSAHFEVRDDLAVKAQTGMDSVARDLISRFQDTAVDPTRAPGTLGLVTDAGAVFVLANEVGVAARLAVNPSVDPEQGGALWRLRDGLNAMVQGPPGNGALLTGLHTVLTASQAIASGPFSGGSRSFATLASDLSSMQASDRVSAEAELSFASARADALQEQFMADGVDTDQEMQKLLLIEQAFSANAKVVQAMDELIQVLIGI
jgi:flagellar hook-associated protein 1